MPGAATAQAQTWARECGHVGLMLTQFDRGAGRSRTVVSVMVSKMGLPLRYG